MIRTKLGDLFEATEGRLKSDWIKIKRLIKNEIAEERFEVALQVLERACYLAYSYNFITNYWDRDIEEYIQRISDHYLGTSESINVRINPNRIVFFDYFIADNRNFSYQYLQAFIKLDVELLLIIYDKKKYDKNSQIIQAVERYYKGSIRVLRSTNLGDKLCELREIVIRFAPEKLFVQTVPWEALTSCLSYYLRTQTKIRSYLINLTDHAYWPGSSCFEFIIDFRFYGHMVNKTLKRRCDHELYVVPTPILTDDSNEFKGFSLDIPLGKVIGFAGGSYYKIVDESHTFLNLIKQVIHENENFLFLFACVGKTGPIEDFIIKHDLRNRFFLIGDRTDIGEVFKRIDIFFNTYPYGGGLMMHYALRFRKPIVALWDEKMWHTRVDLVLDDGRLHDHVNTDTASYLKLVNRLVSDKSFRNTFTRYYPEISNRFAQDFFGRISQIIQNGKVDKYHWSTIIEVNQEAVTRFHIKSERIQKKWYLQKMVRILRPLSLSKRLSVEIIYLIFRALTKFNLVA